MCVTNHFFYGQGYVPDNLLVRISCQATSTDYRRLLKKVCYYFIVAVGGFGEKLLIVESYSQVVIYQHFELATRSKVYHLALIGCFQSALADSCKCQ